MKRIESTAGLGLQNTFRFTPKSGRDPSSEEKAELALVAGIPDEQIDTTDAPELPMRRWRADSVVGKLSRSDKTQY